jgi:hypothetical protein
LEEEVTAVLGLADAEIRRRKPRPRAVFGARRLASLGIEAIGEVTLVRSPDSGTGWFGHGHGQRASLIQKTLDQKSTKVDSYRRLQANEYWLLLVAGTGTGSSIHWREAKEEFRSAFDQTVFLDLYADRCFFVSTRRPTIP